MSALNKSVIDVLKLFAPLPGLKVNKDSISLNDNLLKITPDQISSPTGVYEKMAERLSPLEDQLVPLAQIEKFIQDLKKPNSLTRLNHLGFCYQVASLDQEKTKVLQEMKKSKFDLYQEKSVDKTLWLFIGNDANWTDPMIELLPVEKLKDPWLDLWLPHIHIDIDTTKKAEEIDKIVIKHFGGDPVPFHAIVIDSYIYTVRVRLGVVSGINITLDLATSIRNQDYRRANLLKKLS
ncbi:MAG: hypothetical protein ABID04_02580 [Patescibacteria group bacterium]